MRSCPAYNELGGEKAIEIISSDEMKENRGTDERSPQVSIVLPTYNGSKYLRRSIDSCLNQSYRNIELVIVDDASTDATAEIVKSFKDPRIRYIRNKTNQRLPRALNVGLGLSKGEYLTWTSDDNEFLPEAIEALVKILDQKTVDLVFADFWAKNLDTGRKELRSLPDKLDLKERNAVGPCFLFTRRVYRAIGGYDPKYELVEDYEYWIRLGKRFNAFHYPQPIYIYGEHLNSLTVAKASSVFLLDNILKYQHDFITFAYLKGKFGEYFIRTVGSPTLTKKEAGLILFRDSLKIFRLSVPLGLLYCGVIAYYLSEKIAKRVLHRWAAGRAGHRKSITKLER